MNKSAIVRSLKRPWVGCIATVVGVLLGETMIAAPAYSGDFNDPYYQGVGYRSGCDPCRCNPCCYSCGCSRCGCCGSSMPRRSKVIERHWVEREYWERRYHVGGHRYDRGYADSYESGYPRHPGYGYGAPRPYSASYDYDEPPRPPAAIYGVRSPYYYDGYGE